MAMPRDIATKACHRLHHKSASRHQHTKPMRGHIIPQTSTSRFRLTGKTRAWQPSSTSLKSQRPRATSVSGLSDELSMGCGELCPNLGVGCSSKSACKQAQSFLTSLEPRTSSQMVEDMQGQNKSQHPKTRPRCLSQWHFCTKQAVKRPAILLFDLLIACPEPGSSHVGGPVSFVTVQSADSFQHVVSMSPPLACLYVLNSYYHALKWSGRTCASISLQQVLRRRPIPCRAWTHRASALRQLFSF